jgi:C4-type Zn-finger protein
MVRTDAELLRQPSFEDPHTIVLEQREDEPMLVDLRELTYSYMCKHCGHRWTETHVKDEVEPQPEGYTGD